jgi:hypothetical protein
MLSTNPDSSQLSQVDSAGGTSVTRSGPRVGTRYVDERINLTTKAASWVEFRNAGFVAARNIIGGGQLDWCIRLGHVRELRRQKGWAINAG